MRISILEGMQVVLICLTNNRVHSKLVARLQTGARAAAPLRLLDRRVVRRRGGERGVEDPGIRRGPAA